MDHEIEVSRQSDNGVETLGDMIIFTPAIPSPFKCDTLELPWKENKKRISCIPKGIYSWKKVGATQNIPYPHIWIMDVPNRSGIKIHIANYHRQLLGCIAVGSSEADLDKDGQKDVTDSKKTLEKIMNLLPNSGTIIIH